MSIIYIRNLPGDVREEQLRRVVGEFGTVESIELMRNGASLRANSDCVLRLYDRREAISAARRLNGRYFHGMLLHVEHRPQ